MPTAGRDGQSWQLLRTGRAFRGDSTEPLGTSITLETCRVPPRRRRFEPVLSRSAGHSSKALRQDIGRGNGRSTADLAFPRLVPIRYSSQTPN